MAMTLTLTNEHQDEDLQQSIKTLLGPSQYLKELKMENCTGITGSIFNDIPESLEILLLENCQLITDNDLAKLSDSSTENPKATGLTDLTIVWCENITGSTFDKLPNSLRYLKLLTCKNLTDDGLANLSVLTNLAELTIEHCDNITGLKFHKFPKSLRVLKLVCCKHITDDVPKKLSVLPNLSVLIV
jgi:hypothetical protein